MKIGNSTPVGGVNRVVGRSTERPTAAGGGGTVRRAEDSASVMGIPEAEFTPRVRDAIMTLMAEVDALRRDLERANARLNELEQLANEDPLVPINNRRAFVRELERTVAYAQRYGGTASLIYMDMDGLKQINDQYGHAAGDAAIKRVARTLLENTRRSDVVGRLGGDEFGVILAQADGAVAQQKAENLANAIASAPLVFDGQDIPLSVAFGCHTLGSGDPSHALAAADREMYARKRDGRKTP